MQSARLLFRLRAREIKCPGENPFIRDSLSAALHMEPHPSPFAQYLWPDPLAKTSSESPLLVVPLCRMLEEERDDSLIFNGVVIQESCLHFHKED